MVGQLLETNPSRRRLQFSERHDSVPHHLLVVEQVHQNDNRPRVLHVAQRKGQHLSRLPVPLVIDKFCQFLEHRVIGYHCEAVCDRPADFAALCFPKLFDQRRRSSRLCPRDGQCANDILLDLRVRYPRQPMKQNGNGSSILRITLPQFTNCVDSKAPGAQFLQHRLCCSRVVLCVDPLLLLSLLHPNRVLEILPKLRHQLSSTLWRILRSISCHGMNLKRYLRSRWLAATDRIERSRRSACRFPLPVEQPVDCIGRSADSDSYEVPTNRGPSDPQISASRRTVSG